MDRRTVYFIWGGGLLLAVLIYAAGPDRVLTALDYSFDSLFWHIGNWLNGITGSFYDLMRAAAIAALVVFWVLGVMAVARGQNGRMALLVLSLIFLWLVGGPRHWGGLVPGRDWLAALIVAVLGAVMMTGRLARSKP